MCVSVPPAPRQVFARLLSVFRALPLTHWCTRVSLVEW
ncbi:uncharacterized protein [Leishmania mexicana MHOM/GT/2001/U1103]|uniref:Uncharacterized protein n=1 Tax=Leishmania mexicana (strain MHOM/GT/2001/U1103) TaxID=929439 RepID=E9ALR1_LEIMU|nr:uncharacterized protein [Leishmania mexicana MHOM/GT/2001/U1103]CBZ23866.1 unnamed protein product [Leishmania mexicana MHOM/GT/2001/U1103]